MCDKFVESPWISELGCKLARSCARKMKWRNTRGLYVVSCREEGSGDFKVSDFDLNYRYGLRTLLNRNVSD